MFDGGGRYPGGGWNEDGGGGYTGGGWKGGGGGLEPGGGGGGRSDIERILGRGAGDAKPVRGREEGEDEGADGEQAVDQPQRSSDQPSDPAGLSQAVSTERAAALTDPCQRHAPHDHRRYPQRACRDSIAADRRKGGDAEYE